MSNLGGTRSDEICASVFATSAQEMTSSSLVGISSSPDDYGGIYVPEDSLMHTPQAETDLETENHGTHEALDSELAHERDSVMTESETDTPETEAAVTNGQKDNHNGQQDVVNDDGMESNPLSTAFFRPDYKVGKILMRLAQIPLRGRC